MKFILVCITALLSFSACHSVVGDAVPVRGASQITKSSGLNAHNDTVGSKRNRNSFKLGQITGVDIERLFALLQDQHVLLIDCRPGLYYRMGHIDDAINLPYRKLSARIGKFVEQLDKGLAENKVIVLYCQNYNCPDAYLFAKKVADLGYSTSVYKGGWQEWRDSGL
ncbi:MAG: rhodanese-like domain-containing protein [Akkermansiaceae bacterium]